jgi:hypothetical protein
MLVIIPVLKQSRTFGVFLHNSGGRTAVSAHEPAGAICARRPFHLLPTR